MEERYISLSEAADALDISERTAYRWIKSGKLRAYKPGRDYRIPEWAIKAAIEESEVDPKAGRSSLEPSLFPGLEDELPPGEDYQAAVESVKEMYRRRRQAIVEFENLPSNEHRREVLDGVITAYNILNSAGVSWERTEGLLLRELMINAALHMLNYYKTAPAEEAAVVNLEEARERLRDTA
jgi:excisionase family DNA binding protein